MKPLVIGTRGSKLALWQATWVEEQLSAAGVPSRIKIIKTTGDKATETALTKLARTTGTKGIFTKEIDQALIKGTIDIAVHSLKDLPTEMHKLLTIAAYPERGDPRDAIVGFPLKEIPEGAKVGTGSLRRMSQLRRLRPDVQVLEIRGNVDTRLKKLETKKYDALILAAAGLHRLGLEDRITETLEPAVMCPAVGQGIIALMIRAKDDEIRTVLAPLNHHMTEVAARAERTLLATLGVGCQVPLGGHAALQGDRLRLSAMVVSEDGSKLFCRVVEGSPTNPEALGEEAAKKLLALGAAEIIGAPVRSAKA
jgi:hydroxymethylbilane synthase